MYISVVLPILNMAETVGQQLEALSNQTYTGEWELIVADNGSVDRGRAVCEMWMGIIPRFTIVDASDRRGAAAARNRGVSAAAGSILVFCDADDVVHRRWLEGCASAMRHHDFMAGALDPFSLNGPDVPAWEARALHAAPVALSFKPFALGANMAVSRKAFDAVRGFRDDLMHFEDIDLSWRLQLAGYPLHFEPAAMVAKRYPPDLPGVWRESTRGGTEDVDLYRLFRHHGVELPLGLGPLYSDFRRALTRGSRFRVVVNRRALVAAAARNYSRLVTCLRSPDSLVEKPPSSH